MAKLSEDELKTLKALQEKAEAPDEPERNHSRIENLNFTIDLADDAQVKRAMRLGLLREADLDDGDANGNGGGDADPPKDGEPQRRGDRRFQ